MTIRKITETTVAVCPDCEEEISLKGRIEWGQQVVCPHCGTELEVISTDPMELDWVYDESEYDDDDEEDY